MSATEELRRMLDERMVEWTFGDGTVSYASNGHWCHAWAYNDGAVCVSMGYFTPEQAIEVTLGRTCHNVWDVELTGRLRFQCSDCKAVSLEITPVYCPVCGAKVVEE